MSSYYKVKTYSTDERKMLYPKIVWENVENKEEIISLFRKNEIAHLQDPIKNFQVYRDQDSDIVNLNDFQEGSGLLKVHHWVISKAAKSTLEKFNIGDHNFNKILVSDRGTIHEYFIFQFLPKYYEQHLNFSKSTFTEWSLKSLNILNLNEYSLSDPEEYSIRNRSLYQEGNMQLLGPKKFILSKSIQFLSLPMLGTIVSNELKEAIEIENLTGLKFEELNEVEIEVE